MARSRRVFRLLRSLVSRRPVPAAFGGALLPAGRPLLASPEFLRDWRYRVPEGTVFVLTYLHCVRVGGRGPHCLVDCDCCYDHCWCEREFVPFGADGFPVGLPEAAKRAGGKRLRRKFQSRPWEYVDVWVEAPEVTVEWKPRPLVELGLPADHVVPADAPVADAFRRVCVVRRPDTEALLAWPERAAFALWRDEAWWRAVNGAYGSWGGYAFFAEDGLPVEFPDALRPASRFPDVRASYQLRGVTEEGAKKLAKFLRDPDPVAAVKEHVAFWDEMGAQARIVRALLPLLPGPSL